MAVGQFFAHYCGNSDSFSRGPSPNFSVFCPSVATNHLKFSLNGSGVPVLHEHLNYNAVPDDLKRLRTFSDEVCRDWTHALRRRSQRSCMTWEHFCRFVECYILIACALHPRPNPQFAFGFEIGPYSVVPLVRISSEGRLQPPFPRRPSEGNKMSHISDGRATHFGTMSDAADLPKRLACQSQATQPARCTVRSTMVHPTSDRRPGILGWRCCSQGTMRYGFQEPAHPLTNSDPRKRALCFHTNVSV